MYLQFYQINTIMLILNTNNADSIIRELLYYAMQQDYIELNLSNIDYPDLTLKLAQSLNKEGVENAIY